MKIHRSTCIKYVRAERAMTYKCVEDAEPSSISLAVFLCSYGSVPFSFFYLLSLRRDRRSSNPHSRAENGGGVHYKFSFQKYFRKFCSSV